MMVNFYDVKQAREAGYSWEAIRAAIKDVAYGIGNFWDCVAFQSLIHGPVV